MRLDVRALDFSPYHLPPNKGPVDQLEDRYLRMTIGNNGGILRGRRISPLNPLSLFIGWWDAKGVPQTDKKRDMGNSLRSLPSGSDLQNQSDHRGY